MVNFDDWLSERIKALTIKREKSTNTSERTLISGALNELKFLKHHIHRFEIKEDNKKLEP